MRKKTVLLSAAIIGGLSATWFAVLPARVADAATDCLAGPNAPSPEGKHWYYRVDRASKRRCWYLGPKGGKVRSGRSAAAALQSRAQAPVAPAPAVKAPVAPQLAPPRTIGTIIQESHAAAETANRSGGLAESLAAPVPGQPASPAPIDTAQPSRSAAGSDLPAEADSDDEMPLIWPVLTPAELAAAEPAVASAIRPEYMLAALAGALAFAGFVGRAVFKQTHRRLALSPDFDQDSAPTIIPRDLLPIALDGEARPRRRAGVVGEGLSRHDSSHDVEDALRQLADALGVHPATLCPRDAPELPSQVEADTRSANAAAEIVDDRREANWKHAYC